MDKISNWNVTAWLRELRRMWNEPEPVEHQVAPSEPAAVGSASWVYLPPRDDVQ